MADHPEARMPNTDTMSVETVPGRARYGHKRCGLGASVTVDNDNREKTGACAGGADLTM